MARTPQRKTDAWAEAIARIPSGPKSPFRCMTFTLSEEQAARVADALKAAKSAGPFGATGNANSNGNALARICEAYV